MLAQFFTGISNSATTGTAGNRGTSPTVSNLTASYSPLNVIPTVITYVQYSKVREYLTLYSRTRQVTSFYWTLPTVKTDVAGSCPIGRKKWDLEHSYWISQKQLLPWQKQKSYHRGSTSRECAAVWQCRDYSVYSRYTDI